MKSIFKKYLALPVVALACLSMTACEEDYEAPYRITEDSFQLLQATGTVPVAAKYAVGETVKMELVFNKKEVKEIVLLQKFDTQDSAVVRTIPAQGAFSRTKRADTLVVEYMVPAGLTNKAVVRLDAKAVGFNNASKTRSATFRVAEATPTIRIRSVAYRSGVTSTANTVGDVIRYDLVLNENGVTTATATTPATSILYKDLDSLYVYSKVGTNPETIVSRTNLTKSGAAVVGRIVDVTVPANSVGQDVVYRFEVKAVSPKTAASVTSAPVRIVAATSFSETGTAVIGLNGDPAATSFNFVTRTNTGGGLAANRDITVTSVAGNRFAVKADNTTTFVKSTAALFTSGTVNSVRQAYYTASVASPSQVLTSIADLIVGDVYIARLVNSNNYVIFRVTGINRGATDNQTTATLEYKYL